MARSGLALRVGVLGAVALISGGLLLGCGSSRHVVATSEIPPGLLLQGRPMSVRLAFECHL